MALFYKPLHTHVQYLEISLMPNLIEESRVLESASASNFFGGNTPCSPCSAPALERTRSVTVSGAFVLGPHLRPRELPLHRHIAPGERPPRTKQQRY